MNEETAQKLLEYIANTLELDAPFLGVHVFARVEVTGLLDEIAQLRGISKEENAREFNQFMDMRELKEEEFEFGLDDDEG